jgi:hypothetical protein
MPVVDDIHLDQRTGRGVLYVVWPGEGVDAQLERSVASVKRIHPELPIHVQRFPAGSTLLDKSLMGRFTPFAETLYLDVDTVVLERLDYGFEQARRFGLACCICECPYARRFAGLSGRGDLVEYNTGVVFFTRLCSRLFDRWAGLATRLDSQLPFLAEDGLRVMPVNDQASFAEMIATDFLHPYVLPANWNFRKQWHRGVFGPVKIWHDRSPVPQAIVDWNERHAQPGATMDFAILDSAGVA